MSIVKDTVGAVVPLAAVALLGYLVAKKFGLLPDGGSSDLADSVAPVFSRTVDYLDPAGGLTSEGADVFADLNQRSHDASPWNPAGAVNLAAAQGTAFADALSEFLQSDAFIGELGSGMQGSSYAPPQTVQTQVVTSESGYVGYQSVLTSPTPEPAVFQTFAGQELDITHMLDSPTSGVGSASGAVRPGWQQIGAAEPTAPGQPDRPAESAEEVAAKAVKAEGKPRVRGSTYPPGW